jgi:uncharacterized metal-binding protein YceD (DUF177 family)
VENLSKYQIAYQGLSEGIHDFDFDVDDSFFEGLEYSEIKKGSLKANVLLNKKSTFLELNFKISGSVELLCDRCLDEYNQEIDYEGKIFVKFSTNEGDLAEDVIILSPSDNELDIAHYIYESINLSIPLKRVHPDNEDGEYTCNPEMIKKLENYKINEPTEDENIDPRWNDLKNLKANNNN